MKGSGIQIVARPKPRLSKGFSAALAISVACNAVLLSVCLDYFHILNSAQPMSSVVDWRGGLHEVRGTAPWLAALSVACACFAARHGSLKYLARGLGLASLLLWGVAAILAHFIRTALR